MLKKTVLPMVIVILLFLSFCAIAGLACGGLPRFGTECVTDADCPQSGGTWDSFFGECQILD